MKMNSYDTVIFDMDGTVTETGRGVLNSVQYALDALGYPMPDVPRRLFMGPPLAYSFATYCGLPPELIDEAIRLYRVYYTDKGIFECALYDGMEELFIRLRGEGKKMLIASSKPEMFVKRILEHFGALSYFDFVGGADMAETRSEKPDVLRYTLAEAGVTDLDGAVMVGDREHDILGAKEVGIDSIGVLYGYGERDEFIKAGATHIAATPREVGDIVCAASLRRE